MIKLNVDSSINQRLKQLTGQSRKASYKTGSKETPASIAAKEHRLGVASSRLKAVMKNRCAGGTLEDLVKN